MFELHCNVSLALNANEFLYLSKYNQSVPVWLAQSRCFNICSISMLVMTDLSLISSRISQALSISANLVDTCFYWHTAEFEQFLLPQSDAICLRTLPSESYLFWMSVLADLSWKTDYGFSLLALGFSSCEFFVKFMKYSLRSFDDVNGLW